MKKVIICGIGKIQNDFQYIFPEKEPDWYIWTENSYKYSDINNIYSYEKIDEEDKDNVEVIICDKDKKKCRRKLEEYGLLYGKQFFYAEDYFYTLDFPLQEIAADRRFAVWGTGGAKQKLRDKLYEMDPELEKNISFYIDNDKDKQQTLVDGKKVVDLDSTDLCNTFVIVASGCYKEIRCQLLDKGLEEKRISVIIKKYVFAHPK